MRTESILEFLGTIKFEIIFYWESFSFIIYLFPRKTIELNTSLISIELISSRLWLRISFAFSILIDSYFSIISHNRDITSSIFFLSIFKWLTNSDSYFTYISFENLVISSKWSLWSLIQSKHKNYLCFLQKEMIFSCIWIEQEKYLFYVSIKFKYYRALLL